MAFIQAHRAYRGHGDAAAARTLFLALADQGARGLQASLAESPYTAEA